MPIVNEKGVGISCYTYLSKKRICATDDSILYISGERGRANVASIQKLTQSQVKGLLKHNNRTSEDEYHSNKGIDVSKSSENYTLKWGDEQMLAERLDEVYNPKKSDKIVMCEVIVTMPDEVKPEDERKFFQSVYDFYANDFGEQNILNAVVHKDESKPHIHLDFIPIATSIVEYDEKSSKRMILSKWKEAHKEKCVELEAEYGQPVIEHLNCKELINQKYMREMHGRLYKHIAKDMGYECSIINGATVNGNRTVQELKNEKLMLENNKLEKQLETLKQDIGDIEERIRKKGMSAEDIGLIPLMKKIDDLENRISVYKKIMVKNHYSYTPEEVNELRDKVYKAPASAKVAVYDKSLNDVEIDDNAIIILEMYNKEKRPLPQEKFIKANPDITTHIYGAMGLDTKDRYEGRRYDALNGKRSNRKFIVLHTDNTDDTVAALMEVARFMKEKEEEYEGRKIYMESIDNDRYDFARKILNDLPNQSVFLTGKAIEDKEEKQQQKEMA